MRYIPSDVPVERDRMGACSRYNEHFGEGWAAPPGATEGGAAEATPEAAAEKRESRRGSRGEASPQPGAQQGRIDRRVSSAMPTAPTRVMLKAMGTPMPANRTRAAIPTNPMVIGSIRSPNQNA